MVRVGVIGCGYWGPNLVRNFSSISSSEVVAICDKKKDRLLHIQSLHPNISVTQSYEEILNNDDIKAICVATPVATHYTIAKKALQCGKHVLVEKPLTNNIAHAIELNEIANKNKLILMVGHTFLYNTSVDKIKDILAKRELGKIYYISMERLNLGLFQKDINVVWDLAPHDISVLKYITGKRPLTVSAIGGAHVYKSIEDMVIVCIKFENGFSAHMRLSWIDPHKVRKIVIVGSKKMLVFDDTQPTDKITIYDKGVKVPKHYDTFEDFQFAYKYGDVKMPLIEKAEPLRRQCEHFIDCIKSDKKPRSDGENGIRVVRVIEAIQKSLKNRGRWERIKWE